MKRQSPGNCIVIVLALSVVVAGWGCGGTSRSKKAIRDAETGSTLGGSLSDRAGTGAADGVRQYMDEQAAELAAVESNASRIGEEIRVTLDSANLFAVDSAMLTEESRAELQQLADILVKYPHTWVVVEGHTDNTGDDGYNQKLSERRAVSVRNFFEEAGVAPSRLQTIGYGSLRPIASNATEEGRRSNQRIEISIRPNDKLRERGGG